MQIKTLTSYLISDAGITFLNATKQSQPQTSPRSRTSCTVLWCSHSMPSRWGGLQFRDSRGAVSCPTLTPSTHSLPLTFSYGNVTFAFCHLVTASHMSHCDVACISLWPLSILLSNLTKCCKEKEFSWVFRSMCGQSRTGSYCTFLKLESEPKFAVVQWMLDNFSHIPGRVIWFICQANFLVSLWFRF